MSDDIRKQRLDKLKELLADGVDAYGERYEKTDICDVREDDTNIAVAGRVMAIRRHGGSSFLDIRDFSGKIQVYVKKNNLDEACYKLFEKVDIGDILGIQGSMFRTRMGELTVLAQKIRMLSKSLLPLPEKWHGLKDVEIRFRKRYLDLIMNEGAREVFLKRIKIMRCIREFLGARGFLEVETPMMHSIAGGAEAKPFITHHNALDADLYLRIAPELYLKRLLVGNFEKVYEINRSFRNEGISTMHNPEFTMLELYSAYGDCVEMMEVSEALLVNVVEQACGTLVVEYGDKKIDFTPPWKKMTWNEALKQAGIEDWRDESEVLRKAEQYSLEPKEKTDHYKILDSIFAKKVQPLLHNPTFIHEYPKAISPLARSSRHDAEMTERFELFAGGLEIGNAYSELNDPVEQEARFKESVKSGSEERPKVVDFDYIEALEYGMPPAGGLGIGIDRLVMLLSNSSSIREVIFFPLLKARK